jgi:peroxiredoxin (alkyl hydroperoxide reductase subunit C)
MLTVGSSAPDFALRDQNLEIMTRGDLAGRKSLIVFIPNPFTSVCEAELCTIRDGLSALNDLEANVVAVTCNTPFVNRRWSDENSFGFPVLSDFWPHGEVSRAYGTFNEKFGIPNRHTMVLDGAGVVREIIRSESIAEGREFDLYTKALASI